MAPTPPDPHVRKRGPGLAVIIAAIVIIAGLVIVFANRPGAGMGGSISTSPEQGQR